MGVEASKGAGHDDDPFIDEDADNKNKTIVWNQESSWTNNSNGSCASVGHSFSRSRIRRRRAAASATAATTTVNHSDNNNNINNNKVLQILSVKKQEEEENQTSDDNNNNNNNNNHTTEEEENQSGGGNTSNKNPTTTTRKHTHTLRKSSSFHENLVLQHELRGHCFEDIYEIMEEIGQGGLCKIYKIQKRDEYCCSSSSSRGGNNSRRSRSADLVRRRRNKSKNHNHHQQQQPPTTKISKRRFLPAFFRQQHHHADVGLLLSASAVLAPTTKLTTTSTTTTRNLIQFLPRVQSSPSLTSQEVLVQEDGKNNINKTVNGSDATTPVRKVQYALKVINLVMVQEDRIDQLKNEVEILKTLDHKNIIKAYETFRMANHHNQLMIVMELCTGGDLYARIPYSERQAAAVTRQVLSAISYLHCAKNIIHRDIKFENILFESMHPQAAIKVIDFGLSKVYSSSSSSSSAAASSTGNNTLTERVGTLYSMAPETLQGMYTEKADLWSVGVCTYMLLAGGQKPFDGSTPKQVVAAVLRGKYDTTDGEIWQKEEDEISNAAKEFLAQLLVVNPETRATAATALTHPWIARCRRKTTTSTTTTTTVVDTSASSCCAGAHDQATTLATTTTTTTGDTFSLPLSCSNDTQQQQQKRQQRRRSLSSLIIDDALIERVMESMVRFAHAGEFRKLALNVIAKKSTAQEIFELRQVFEAWDTLHTGTLTVSDLQNALCNENYSMDEITTIFQNVDVNGTNVINYTEFLAATLETQGHIEEYRLAEAFDLMDMDSSGYISRENLRQILGGECDEEYIDRLIAEADFHNDGKICYEEFLQVFSGEHKKEMASIYEVDSHSDQTGSSTDEVLRHHGILSSFRKRGASSRETGRSRKENKDTLKKNKQDDKDSPKRTAKITGVKDSSESVHVIPATTESSSCAKEMNIMAGHSQEAKTEPQSCESHLAGDDTLRRDEEVRPAENSEGTRTGSSGMGKRLIQRSELGSTDSLKGPEKGLRTAIFSGNIVGLPQEVLNYNIPGGKQQSVTSDKRNRNDTVEKDSSLCVNKRKGSPQTVVVGLPMEDSDTDSGINSHESGCAKTNVAEEVV